MVANHGFKRQGLKECSTNGILLLLEHRCSVQAVAAVDGEGRTSVNTFRGVALAIPSMHTSQRWITLIRKKSGGVLRSGAPQASSLTSALNPPA